MQHPIVILFLSAFVISCQAPESQTQSNTSISYQNKAHELVAQMVEKVGSMQDLHELKDVTYTYTYTTPDGKTDITEEKYIFDGELSYGKYIRHERTLANLEGTVEQGYDGKQFWIKHQDQILQDSQLQKRTIFNRKTNYYWFTMMQKLLDPGLHYQFIGEKETNGHSYDVVKITFDTTGSTKSDIYQIFINKQTHLVDQFLFTVVDYDVIETPFLMRVEYQEVDGISIPSQRQYTKSDWNAEPLNDQWITVEWTDIKFNNHLIIDEFKS